MMRAVIDNNVVVSALIFDGVTRAVFNSLLLTAKIVTSAPVLIELVNVLGRKKFDKYLTQDERMRFLTGFLTNAEIVDIIETVSICRDPKDNMLLELAVAGEANFLITGDTDLLVLHPFREVQIMTPREFFEMRTQ